MKANPFALLTGAVTGGVVLLLGCGLVPAVIGGGIVAVAAQWKLGGSK